MEISIPQVAATAIINGSFACMIGILFARLCLLAGDTQWRECIRKPLSMAMSAAIVACVSASAVSLWLQAAAMSDMPTMQAGAATWMMLTKTYYGHVGAVGIGVLLTLLVVERWMQWAKGTMPSLWISTALLLLFAFLRVSVGHATEHGVFSIAIWIEWLHLLFIALWVGSVGVSGWVVLPRSSIADERQRRASSRYLTLLSKWATVALIMIVLTGTYNAYRVLDNVYQLAGTSYGQVLLFKLGMVAIAVSLGAFNRLVGFPAVATATLQVLAPGRAMHRLVTVLRVESLFLIAALIAAAILTGQAPLESM